MALFCIHNTCVHVCMCNLGRHMLQLILKSRGCITIQGEREGRSSCGTRLRMHSVPTTCTSEPT